MRRAAAIALVLAAGACRRGAEAPSGPPPAVRVEPGSIAMAVPAALESGPLVSGTLQPTREATLRSQVSGTVLAAPPEVGSRVTAGMVLCRFDASALEEAQRSAASALRSARLAEQVASRQAERAAELAKRGAGSSSDAETARSQLLAARAAVADAASRLAASRSNLGYADVKAPFDGVISARSVKAGDIVQPGAPLATVIDPTSLQLQAAVPADQIGQVKVGQTIELQVTGYDQRFVARIDRISPATDPATGQVAVTAELPNGARGLVAGLHAEGRVLALRQSGLVVPLAAIDHRSLSPEVLRLRDGVVQRVQVRLGLVDDIDNMVIVEAGLTPGDVVLVGAARQIPPDTRVRVETVSARG